MDPVETAHGIAATARLAFVAVGRHVVEVVTTRALHEVAAGRRHVAKLCGGAVQNGLRQERKLRANNRVRRQMAVPDHRANPDAAAGALFDRRQRKPADIDYETRLLDAFTHEIDQIRASGEKPRGCRRAGCGVNRRLMIVRPHVLEGVHRDISAKASRMAARMPTYAPQRHRFPLIRSRNSSSLSWGDESGLVTALGAPIFHSANIATAEQI